ncbi:MAG: CorA family divalent cation transporter [Bryobacteraceae bacterium]|nr:CorA family divalent cation transporter [Bryobacteraceae bacterium]
MEPSVSHLHTYFLFPFSIDRDVVLEEHPDYWAGSSHWISGLDRWIGAHSPDNPSLLPWKRAPYARFDRDSQAYADMVFFHPFVRRVFFDTAHMCSAEEQESLLRTYAMPTEGRQLKLTAADARGKSSTVDVTDLRLFLFANGIGVLTIGVEATNRPIDEALWINEQMRKVYPSSGRQLREGRVPNLIRLTEGDDQRVLIEERFEQGSMRDFLPPLSKLITSLLYFSSYEDQQYEPVLDERMIVYTYVALDRETLPEGVIEREDYDVLFSRILYVDRNGSTYRYDPGFIRQRMEEHVYRRWAHQGTLYGFTSYSCATLALGTFDCDNHLLREGFLIHRMFDTRYYLMAVVALFYRATVLDFAERTALTSKRLYNDYEDGKYMQENIAMVGGLRAEFLHFSNYWHFDELANKDEEIEHFEMQCRVYRISPMKAEIENELEKLNSMLTEYYTRQSTEAVNRLAVVSMVLGAGAVLTGFFGMNFGAQFEKLFFQPGPNPWLHWLSIAGVSLFAAGSLSFATYLLVANWSDYRHILVPGALRQTQRSLRKWG